MHELGRFTPLSPRDKLLGMKGVTLVDGIIGGGVLLFCALALIEFAPSQGDRAAEAFQSVKNSGASDTQLCRSARAVQDAYAAEGDTAEAANWDGWATTHCLGASFNEGYQDPRLRAQAVQSR
jgi:hypothetical protein